MHGHAADSRATDTMVSGEPCVSVYASERDGGKARINRERRWRESRIRSSVCSRCDVLSVGLFSRASSSHGCDNGISPRAYKTKPRRRGKTAVSPPPSPPPPLDGRRFPGGRREGAAHGCRRRVEHGAPAVRAGGGPPLRSIILSLCLSLSLSLSLSLTRNKHFYQSLASFSPSSSKRQEGTLLSFRWRRWQHDADCRTSLLYS